MQKEQKSKIVFSSIKNGIIEIESIYGDKSERNEVVKNVSTSVGISSLPTATLELVASSKYPNLISIKSGDEVFIYAGETGIELKKIFHGVLKSVKLKASKESAELNIESVSPFYFLQKRKISSINFKTKKGLREFFSEIIAICGINGTVEFDSDVDNQFELNSFKNFPALSLINTICYERDLVYDFNSGDKMTVSNRESILHKMHNSIPIVIDDDKIISREFEQ